MQRIDVRKHIMEETKKIGETRYIETLSVKEICDRCQISRPTFYTYFKDKYDLIDQIYRFTVSEAFKNTDINTPWKVVMGNMMKSIMKDRRFYMNTVKYSGQNALKDMMLNHSYNGYISQYRIRSGTEPDASILKEIRFNAYGTTGLLLDWIRDGMEDDPYDIADKVYACMPEKIKQYFE